MVPITRSASPASSMARTSDGWACTLRSTQAGEASRTARARVGRTETSPRSAMHRVRVRAAASGAKGMLASSPPRTRAAISATAGASSSALEVGVTPKAPRVNSGSPKVVRMRPRAWLTALWVMLSASAARVTLRWVSRASNTGIRFRSSPPTLVLFISVPAAVAGALLARAGRQAETAGPTTCAPSATSCPAWRTGPAAVRSCPRPSAGRGSGGPAR